MKKMSRRMGFLIHPLEVIDCLSTNRESPPGGTVVRTVALSVLKAWS